MRKNLPNHFMVSECDGGLYDTRKTDWHKKPAIRPSYAVLKSKCDGDTQALRAAIRQKFAWPGGYALFGIAADSECLCMDCMKAEYFQIAYSTRHKINDQWRIVAIESAANVDGPIDCAHCGIAIVPDDSEGV
jgi:hypothetical protein